MGEFSEALKNRYSRRKNSEIVEMMNKQRVKIAILTLCDKYIQDAGDTLTFESSKNNLQYVVTAINEDPLVTKYNIQQISETLFQACLVELGI